MHFKKPRIELQYKTRKKSPKIKHKCASLLFSISYHFRWIAHYNCILRDIFSNDRSSTYGCAISYLNITDDNTVSTDGDIVANSWRLTPMHCSSNGCVVMQFHIVSNNNIGINNQTYSMAYDTVRA